MNGTGGPVQLASKLAQQSEHVQLARRGLSGGHPSLNGSVRQKWLAMYKVEVKAVDRMG